jgi:adenosylcobinamide-GDP ribazoletransferase
MSALKRSASELIVAIQFLTRIPVPSLDYREDSLAGAVKFFPLVGVLVGGLAALFHGVIGNHLPRLVSAFVVVLFLVLVTGCLHEDGLADVADGFGGGQTRERILLILRDSRIGSYGAAALCLSLVGRVALIASIPNGLVARYLIVAAVLCRWTALPLSYFLPAAREREGQGVRIARRTTRASLLFGTIFALTIAAFLLRWFAVAPVIAASLIALLSGRFYRRKIGGMTGDCFGATTQVAEIAIYCCGVWVA